MRNAVDSVIVMFDMWDIIAGYLSDEFNVSSASGLSYFMFLYHLITVMYLSCGPASHGAQKDCSALLPFMSTHVHTRILYII